MPATGLDALVRPRAVAVVGASADPGKAGNAMARSLAGFPGPLYPVNPKGGAILGRVAYRSIAELPATPDLVVLVVPPRAVPPLLAECGARGVPAAVICAGGFAESGPDGALLQQRVGDLARRHAIRLLGPNTSGLMRPDAGLFANFMPGVDQLKPGPAAFVAQSGGMNLQLCFQADADGLGISLGIGLGNCVDVGFVDALDHLANDPATTAVGLHIEGVSDGRALCAAIHRLSAVKPVVALKVGYASADGRADGRAGQVVAEFARSHTGALAGDYRVSRSALEQAGAVLVDSPTELVDAVRALAGGRLPASARPGVGVVTGQAGPGLVIADGLARARVPMPALGPGTTAVLARLLPPLTHRRNPVDTGRPAATFGEVLGAVAADPEVDLLVVHALEEPGAFDPATALAAATSTGTRALFSTQGPAADLAKTAAALDPLGVPSYPAPERAGAAARALVADALARYRLARSGPASWTEPGTAVAEPATAEYTEYTAKALLSAAGVPVPEGRRCVDRAAAHTALAALTGQVAVKVLHPGVAHKSELGGVHTGVSSRAELDAALDAIDAIGLPGPVDYLVERQAPGGIELMVGAIRDPAFGAVVLLGLGGHGAELAAPVGLRLAPLSVPDAEELVDALPEAVLTGFRGYPAVDRAALAELLRRVASLFTTRPELVELEINPLRLTRSGPLALDALITVAGGR
jgi:acetyltransferase